VAALFSFIGAVPRTDWLPAEIAKDAKGFVRTGPALAQSGHWSARRPPYLLETSRPGVFAAGDVRSGSIKRVASAGGEGAMAVQFAHEYLKEVCLATGSAVGVTFTVNMPLEARSTKSVSSTSRCRTRSEPFIRPSRPAGVCPVPVGAGYYHAD